MAQYPLSMKAAAILNQFPGPVTLHPSRLKWTVFFVPMAMIAGLGAWSMWDGATQADWWEIGWGLYLLLIGGTLAAMSVAATLTNFMTLTLDAEGLRYRRYRCLWKNADRFGAVWSTVPGLNTIVFHDAMRPVGFWYSIGGMNVRLGDTFGLRADDFASLLTAWRERALAQSQ
jgi:hypothetical protein